jgi:hypothetical protein
LAGGAIVSLVGTLASGGFGYFGGQNDREIMRDVEICKRAFEILSDESLNTSLSQAEKRAFTMIQLQIAQKCIRQE